MDGKGAAGTEGRVETAYSGASLAVAALLVVSKRAASRYRSGPSKTWIKTKNVVESEFVLLDLTAESRCHRGIEV
jgi:ATP-dependent DNA ligase